MDPRAALILRAAYLMAALGVVAAGFLISVLDGADALRLDTVTLAVVPIPLNLWVVWAARRQPGRDHLQRLALAQVLVAAAVTSLALAVLEDRRAGILIILAALFAYSALVLDVRRHLAASGAAIVLAAGGAVLGRGMTPQYVGALVVLAVIAALATVGARMHAIELAERERAAMKARRAARALEAAVQGIVGSTTTDHDRIVETVTRAAGRLFDGPAALYVLGDDGLLRPDAMHRVPPRVAGLTLRPDDGLFGLVMERGVTQMVTAEEADPLGRMHRMLGLQMVIATPVRVDGEVIGTLLAGHAEDRDWEDQEIDAFTLLAEHAGRALELAQESVADRRSLTRMAELDRIRDDVVTTVSHELRTPVTVIAGLSETLARHRDLSRPQREQIVDRLWANGITLRRIVEQLLDATLLERGELVPDMQPVQLGKLVRRTAARLTPLLTEHTVTFAVPEDLVVEADAGLLDRVLENLLANAIRHTPAGTTVEVSARPVPVGIEVVIADDGPGIDAVDIHRVLERFGRSGNMNERARGIGIGLAFADEILRAHGSGMHVQSRPGRGARFSFLLPRARASDDGGGPDGVSP